MNNKEMIEEMAKDIFNTCAWRFGNPNDYHEICKDIAKDLIKSGYRKLPEGSIVLNAKDIETTCKHCRSKYEKIIEELEDQRDRQAYITEDLIQAKHRWTEQARKETAKEFAQKIKSNLLNYSVIDCVLEDLEFDGDTIQEALNDTLKQFGVEVNDCE